MLESFYGRDKENVDPLKQVLPPVHMKVACLESEVEAAKCFLTQRVSKHGAVKRNLDTQVRSALAETIKAAIEQHVSSERP